MGQYQSDPRAEEIQLLRQCQRQAINTRHTATYDIAKRLEAKGETMGWWEPDATYSVEITAAGIKVLKGIDNG